MAGLALETAEQFRQPPMGLRLSEAALVGLGIATGQAIASNHEKRDEIRRTLQEAAREAGREEIRSGKAKTQKSRGAA